MQRAVFYVQMCSLIILSHVLSIAVGKAHDSMGTKYATYAVLFHIGIVNRCRQHPSPRTPAVLLRNLRLPQVVEEARPEKKTCYCHVRSREDKGITRLSTTGRYWQIVFNWIERKSGDCLKCSTRILGCVVVNRKQKRIVLEGCRGEGMVKHGETIWQTTLFDCNKTLEARGRTNPSPSRSRPKHLQVLQQLEKSCAVRSTVPVQTRILPKSVPL